jgi:hypothetical protein
MLAFSKNEKWLPGPQSRSSSFTYPGESDLAADSRLRISSQRVSHVGTRFALALGGW